MILFKSKILLFFIGLILVSCQADVEVPAGPEFSTVPISFGASDDAEGMTRGSENGVGWSTTNGSKMAMWAYFFESGSSTPLGMMQEQTLKYDAANTRWDYSPVIYWPKSGTMDFFSYAPVCDDARKQFNTLTPNHINYQAMLMKCHVPASQITSIHTLTTIGTAESPCPHDASRQYDLMFAFQRNIKCEEQSVTSKVPMNMAHVMSGIKFEVSGLKTATDDNGTPSDPSDDVLKVPAGTDKIVIGIGRIKTGGTVAICEPAGDPRTTTPEVVWTLDNLEGTFYETYDVEWSGSPATIASITREKTGKPAGITDGAWENTESYFFFPPQPVETGLTITAYFYTKNTSTSPVSFDRTGFRTLTLPISGTGAITQLERGKILTLKIQ